GGTGPGVHPRHAAPVFVQICRAFRRRKGWTPARIQAGGTRPRRYSALAVLVAQALVERTGLHALVALLVLADLQRLRGVAEFALQLLVIGPAPGIQRTRPDRLLD